MIAVCVGDLVTYRQYPGAVFRVTKLGESANASPYHRDSVMLEFVRGSQHGIITMPGSWWALYPAQINHYWPAHVRLPQGV